MKAARRSDGAAKAAAPRTFDLNADPVDDEEEEGLAEEETVTVATRDRAGAPVSVSPPPLQHQQQPPCAPASSDNVRHTATPPTLPAPPCNRVSYCDDSVAVYRGVCACIGGDRALVEALDAARKHVMDPANISSGLGGWWNKDGKQHHPLQFTYGSTGSIDPTDTMYRALHHSEVLPPAIVRLRDELARVMQREDDINYLVKADCCTVTQYVSGTLIEPRLEPELFIPLMVSINAGGGATGRMVDVGRRTSFMIFPGDACVMKEHAYKTLRHGSRQPFSPPTTDGEKMIEFTFFMWKPELKTAARCGVLQWPPPTPRALQRLRSFASLQRLPNKRTR